MKQRHIDEIKGIIILAIAILIFASLISYTHKDLSFYTSHPNSPAENLVRIFGAYLAGLSFFLLGKSSLIIPFILSISGIKRLIAKGVQYPFSKKAALIILILVLSSILGLVSFQDPTRQFAWGGILGVSISQFMVYYFGRLGASVILFALGLLSLLVVGEFLLFSFFQASLRTISKFFGKCKKIIPPLSSPRRMKLEKERHIEPPLRERKPYIEIKPLVKESPAGALRKKQERVLAEPSVGIKEEYKLPSLDLLGTPPPLSSRQIKEDLLANSRILEETLADFGIGVKVTNVQRGPVITRYELEPAPGVKLTRILSLSDDIALAMKALSVQIIAPIPGKGCVGIEVPNTQMSLVYLKEVLSSSEFQRSSSKLTLALGKDVAGKSVIADLDSMPHLLIAGTTGSGKTVCVNSMIVSFLFQARPSELKFLMVDPKMVEMAIFRDLPHLLCPILSQAKEVSSALNWMVNEMEERYKLLAKEGKRNIESYNQTQQKLPYIIVIVDELADLMAIAASQIENAITRLAQLSRAVGIHLVLATQRPSVDVVTGVIKANFPARISFKVASKVDSRTVLDMNGADKLLGKGDLLFLKPGESRPIRAQGSLIEDKDIERIVGFIKQQAQAQYDDKILKEKSSSFYPALEEDELFPEAVRIVLESEHASVSILQRRLRLGYTRAARLIDMMEEKGIIGSYQGSKPRKILVDKEEYLKEYSKT